jgi:hypothetical protein
MKHRIQDDFNENYVTRVNRKEHADARKGIISNCEKEQGAGIFTRELGRRIPRVTVNQY